MPSDTLDGCSPEKAWRTTRPLKGTAIRPGDSILFRRGGQWASEHFEIRQRGRLGNPVVLGSYGPKKLPKPHLVDSSAVVLGIGADHIVVSGLKLSGARRYGISTLGKNRQGLELRGNEISHCTNGIMIHQARNVEISNNYIHSIYYNRSEQGAIGITIDNSSNVLISNNSIRDCIGELNKKLDGGAIEIFRSSQDLIIKKNRASNTWGFVEFGGLRNDTIRNVLVDSNLAVNTRLLAWFNLDTPQDTTNIWGVGYLNVTLSHNFMIQNASKINNPIGANTFLTDSSQIKIIHNTITGDSLFGFFYKGGFLRQDNKFWSPIEKAKQHIRHKTEAFSRPQYPRDTVHLSFQ